MAYQAFPTWLSSFSLSILDQANVLLFHTDENELDDVEFEEGLGCVVNSIIEIKNTKYKVVELQFYLGKDRRIKTASSQVIIIVSETDD